MLCEDGVEVVFVLDVVTSEYDTAFVFLKLWGHFAVFEVAAFH